MEEHVNHGQSGWVDRVPASQEMLSHQRGSVALAVLVVLGQPGLLGAGEPLSWVMLLSWRVGSAWLDLGVPRAGG